MKNNSATDSMKRGEFLRSLGMSSAALMAFYCMGTTLTSCSKSSDTVTPSTGTGTTTGTGTVGFSGNADASAGAISYTLDLTSTAYSNLKTVGKFAIVGSTIVAKTKDGSVIALSKICTHENTTVVQYRPDSDDIYCTNHGSTFSKTGAVLVAPATKPLTQYKTSLSTDGNTLTVTA